MARLHHLRAQIMAVEPNARQSASVIVIAPNRYLDMLVQHQLPEHLTRGLATGLADLRRINAVNTQLAGRPACVTGRTQSVSPSETNETLPVKIVFACTWVAAMKRTNNKRRTVFRGSWPKIV